MARTSTPRLFEIAELRISRGDGRIGVTACPGKAQADALTDGWRRDLDADLDRIAEWGAAVVVTLVEAHELSLLKVPSLGEEVRRRHMEWLHLPIRDFSIPGADFERAWNLVSPHLHQVLAAGFNILVHCRGGLGRSGLIAARLLVEGRTPAGDAISAVRVCRPGAIETKEQEQFVRSLPAAPSLSPNTRIEACRDRAIGSMVGLAVGDALGTTIEFSPRDKCAFLTDIVGGGPFRLKAGEWTDDTAMALALAESLIHDPDVDPHDLMNRFVRWWRKGEYSCTGRCFDIGNATRAALGRYEASGDPIAGDDDPHSAGNGSLMRLAPVAIRHPKDDTRRKAAATVQSRTTHAAPEAVDACVIWSDIVADAIVGLPRADVLTERTFTGSPRIAEIVRGSWRGKTRNQIKSSGYVAHTLEAALWVVGRTTNFSDAVIQAANLGGDSDTTAAVAGQLAGALYGVSGIPPAWRRRIAWSARIEQAAAALLSKAEPALSHNPLN